MNARTRTILLLVVGLVAAMTVISIRNRLSQAPDEPVATAPQNRVLIAKRDLAAGSFVQPLVDLDWGPAPEIPDGGTEIEPLLHEGTARPEDFNGAIVRHLVHAGTPIPQSALVKAGGGGLMSAVLDPHMRAVSIAVNPTSGNAGFVLPGDYVDLILTREVNHNVNNGRDSEARKMVFSKTFIENVRVLAADQALDNPDSKAVLAKTITVEVTPTQAQMITVAAELGKISMSLRSAVGVSMNGDTNAPPENGVTDSDVSSSPEASQQVKLMRPKDTQNLEFYNGVSSAGTSGVPPSADLPLIPNIPGTR